MPHLRMTRILFGSVRGRLVLLVGGITLAGLALGSLLVFRAYRNERAAVSHHLQVGATALSTMVDRQLGSSVALLRGLSVSPFLASDDLAAFDAAARRVTNGEFWLVVTDPAGQQLVNTKAPPGTPLPRTEIEPEAAEAFQRGDPYVSNLVPGPVVKGPVLFVSVPVSRGGALRYILSCATTPAVLGRELSVQHIATNGVIGIVDRRGVIAARNRGADQFVGRSATPDIVRAIAATSEGVVESVTLEGIPVLTAFARAPISGWTVLNAEPRTELYASARGLLGLAAALSGLLLLVALALAAWIGRSLVRAVDALVADTRLIGQGGVPAGRDGGLVETEQVALALRSTAQGLRDREADLRQLNAQLESRVVERTRDLLLANRDLEDFARIAAHDLREPLRTIAGFSSLLQEDHTRELSTDARALLERIAVATARMSRLLDGILAFSQATTTKRTPTRVDLKQTLADVMDDLSARIQETGGSVTSGRLATIDGEPRELHQLLMNLVGNGLKFRRPGVPPRVHVSCVEERDRVRLIVEDNGIGFAQSAAEKIFAPFERLHSDGDYEGTGMGLAIVRRIAERHQGSVRAFGTPGEGSRFEVLFPVSLLANAA
jgi:signal transduction histidine kinase